MGRYSFLVLYATLVLTVLPACEAPGRRDLEYRANKAEGERDRLQAALDDERAKVVILQERLTEKERERGITLTEANLTRDRLRQLEQDNEKLAALLRPRESMPEPPVVPPSPLPATVDQQLQAFAARHGERVWYDRGRAAVSFANDRLFEPGSDVVDATARPVLGELAGIAAGLSAGEFEVIVVGHTDDTPISGSATLARHPSNWHLSVHRAIAVKNVLITAGLPESQMGVMGCGANRPLGNDKARNRRAEVYFVRTGEVRALPAIRAPAATEQ
ncbi:MAG: OmpA family protein [Planctomycetes bacterium]|nr:OmpA family protein [Planctomycetota bacterium]